MGRPVRLVGRSVPCREAGRTFDDSALPVGSMCRVEYYLKTSRFPRCGWLQDNPVPAVSIDETVQVKVVAEVVAEVER